MVLAVDEVFKAADETVQLVPEIELTDDAGVQREVDFAVTQGSQLWLGEAFTDARYRAGSGEMDRLRRLAEAAELCNARAALLATAASAVATDTQARAGTAFPHPRPAVEFAASVPFIRRPTRLIDNT